MIYEYEFVTLDLTEEQKQVMRMGLANIDQINAMLRDTINKKAIAGWEPLYPFSVPDIWFRRIKPKKTRKKA